MRNRYLMVSGKVPATMPVSLFIRGIIKVSLRASEIWLRMVH